MPCSSKEARSVTRRYHGPKIVASEMLPARRNRGTFLAMSWSRECRGEVGRPVFYIFVGYPAILFRWPNVRLKINCVVMNGVNTDELADFLDFTRDQELDVRFIEWMPFDDNRWKDSKFFSYQVRRRAQLACELIIGKFASATAHMSRASSACAGARYE